MAHKGSAGGPTKLKPQSGSAKGRAATEENFAKVKQAQRPAPQPASPERAPEPAPQNTVIVQKSGGGRARVTVLLGVLLALEMVIHPAIKTWAQSVLSGLNTALSKPGGK